MNKYQRIMHTPDTRINDCTNEFLVVTASRVAELEKKGFREVGRTFGLVNDDFQPGVDWIPNISIVPIGEFREIDEGIKSLARTKLEQITKDLDAKAFDINKVAEKLALAIPITGDLYLVHFAHSWWDTRVEEHRELLLIPQGNENPRFQFVLHKGISWLDNDRKTHLVGSSMSAYYAKNYPMTVRKITKVGEMRTAPVFLESCKTSPRMGWTGYAPYSPRLSRYVDFEKHVLKK